MVLWCGKQDVSCLGQTIKKWQVWSKPFFNLFKHSNPNQYPDPNSQICSTTVFQSINWSEYLFLMYHMFSTNVSGHFVKTISSYDHISHYIRCRKVLLNRWQQLIGDVEMRRQECIIFLPDCSRTTHFTSLLLVFTRHLNVHSLFLLVCSGLILFPWQNMWVCLQRWSNTCVQISMCRVWNPAGAAAGSSGI